MPLPAVYVDRDGVINRYPGDGKYVTSLKSFRFLPRAAQALALLSKKGYAVIVISNQAGVAKGLYTEGDLDAITGRITGEVAARGGKVTAVYYCTHHPAAGCSCRKPKTGMIERARRAHNAAARGSFFIGDSMKDIQTARAAGCTAVLVLSGKETLANRDSWDVQPDFVFRNLYEAARYITQ